MFPPCSVALVAALLEPFSLVGNVVGTKIPLWKKRRIFNYLQLVLAEREGFEPSVRFNTVHLLSRQARSTTPAPLRIPGLNYICSASPPNSISWPLRGVRSGLFRASCPPPLRGRLRFAATFKFAPGEFVEPSVRFNTVHLLSRQARSTTPASLRILELHEGRQF